MSGNAVTQFILDPADRDGDRIALIDGPTGATTTRAQLATGAMKAAGALATLGIKPEQRVMLIMADRPAFLEVFWGAIALGAVPVPISTMLPTKDYRFLIHDSRAVAVVVSDVFAEQVLPATSEQPFLEHILIEGATQTARSTAPNAQTLSYAELHSAATELPLFPNEAEDTAFWLYTSGTTGFPKGALHRHGDMSFLTETYAKGVLNVTEDDRMYMVPKLFFAYGLGVNYFALGCGASHVLFDGRPTVEAVVDHVRRHQPTLFWAVPTFLSQLLSSDTADDTFSSVRATVTGGETLPGDIGRRCLDRFGFAALDSIGSTEVGHIYIANTLEKQKPGSTGWVVDGFEVELRDPEGNLVPDGEPGELYVAGDSVTPGYWRRTEQNRTVFHGRFLATGDTFQRDDDGAYTYLGRGDDMIKAGGIWVSPAEVEAAIIEMPEVALAAVVGAPDDERLEKPKAFVLLEAGVVGDDTLAAKIQNHVRERLAPFKYPRWVTFVDELPQTATGKVKRYLLRE
ncbi:MAG: benzoate-CoA ligase family protein [Acidimicrobiales bacterium]|jgi:benzoate-CoA ligase family protein